MTDKDKLDYLGYIKGFIDEATAAFLRGDDDTYFEALDSVDARLAHYLRSIGRETCNEADVHEFALVSIKNAAALSFYMFTNPYVLMKGTTADKYEAVAKNVRAPLEELQ